MSSGIQEGMEHTHTQRENDWQWRNVEQLEPMEPMAPAGEQELVGKEPVGTSNNSTEPEMTRKELSGAANDLAASIAGIVLDKMKQDDGPCKWVLQAFWQTSNNGVDGLMHDVRYLQGVWHMGKLKFSVQLNTKPVYGIPSKPVLLDLIDNAQDAGLVFVSNKDHNVNQMHLYLMKADNMGERIPFPWTGHDLKAYASLCRNGNVFNPTPVRYYCN